MHSCPDDAPCSRQGACRERCGRDTLDLMLADPDLSNEVRDAVLDFKFLIVSHACPSELVAGFYALRSALRNRLYLSQFKLRRWLESRFEAEVEGERTPLKLGFGNFENLVNSLRREYFEHRLDSPDFARIDVRFVESVAVAA